VDIATGQPESHPTVLPADPSASPGVARPPVTAGQQSPADQGGVFDGAGFQQDRLTAYESDWHSAQAAGMAAETGRRTFYEQDIRPQGASYGIEMQLPDVPSAALPPAQGFGYPWPGDEPVPAPEGLPAYGHQ
jgi:hypothetical protein